jgi:hypothetical protein
MTASSAGAKQTVYTEQNHVVADWNDQDGILRSSAQEAITNCANYQ